MPSINGNGKKMIKGLFWFSVFLVGVSVVTYTQVIPEPAKLLLLGAFLIGVAYWCKKKVAENGVRTTDDVTTDNGTTAGSEQIVDNRTTGLPTTGRQEAASGMRLAAKR